MEQKKETNEVRYSVARKLLNLMLENGFISDEEYKKNRCPEPGNIFSGVVESIWVKTLDISENLWYCVVLTGEQ